MPQSMQARYQRLVDGGTIERDPAQLALLNKFSSLTEDLKQFELASKKSSLGWLFAKSGPRTPPKGIYIWGGVGRGKTMLMDLFFEESPIRAKKRFHFHAFMADVHERIHAQRTLIKQSKAKDGDPIVPVADALSENMTLLCFDEFYVVDIADAMILGRLFERFFENGVTLVATSNVDPDELYPDGLNRELFLPFIALLKSRVNVVELVARTDFRLEKLSQAKTYFAPLNQFSADGLDQAWLDLTGDNGEGVPAELEMKGRKVVIPRTSQGVARASFDEICNKPLAAADYIAMAQIYHSFILENIPLLTQGSANAARRFINFVDALYNYRVKLIASAADAPNQLYSAKSGNELFAFDRTISRLIEMQSQEYLAQPHGMAVDEGADREVCT